jgi:3-hydroxyisobutyrate dehydrogenase-like beta-hydroxyacid dehydrogenase
MHTIVLLHPGAMGASIGKALTDVGHEVRWVSEGRSLATRDRALAAGLQEMVSLPVAVEGAGVVLSVCPPAAAGDVATAIGRLRFDGIYVDANAIAPQTARRIGDNLASCGAAFVDGGIIGPPAATAGSTRLYLSGRQAETVAGLFAGTVIETHLVDDRPGSASAVKVCFAAWTKGTTALLLSIRALAAREGVAPNLLNEWAISIPELVDRSELVARSGLKAWRFAPEMEEIAVAFDAADLPKGFHEAAADIYSRLADFKNADPPPTLPETIERLTSPSANPPPRPSQG